MWLNVNHLYPEYACNALPVWHNLGETQSTFCRCPFWRFCDVQRWHTTISLTTFPSPKLWDRCTSLGSRRRGRLFSNDCSSTDDWKTDRWTEESKPNSRCRLRRSCSNALKEIVEVIKPKMLSWWKSFLFYCAWNNRFFKIILGTLKRKLCNLFCDHKKLQTLQGIPDLISNSPW